MNESLVKRLFKLVQEKVWIGELTIPMTIAADWDVKQQNKQTLVDDDWKDRLTNLVIGSQS